MISLNRRPVGLPYQSSELVVDPLPSTAPRPDVSSPQAFGIWGPVSAGEVGVDLVEDDPLLRLGEERVTDRLAS
ncbi:MAG: hypothetical protein JWN96_1221 [Mycobacterium sp.]|nr:hypothetical protein [Mycobacterium sp.]